GLLLWFPPPQLPELPAQDNEGLVSSGAVSELEQPVRVSARSAPRGRSVGMTASPVEDGAGGPASASVRPPRSDRRCWRWWETIKRGTAAVNRGSARVPVSYRTCVSGLLRVKQLPP